MRVVSSRLSLGICTLLSICPLVACDSATSGPQTTGPLLPKPKELLQEARKLGQEGQRDTAIAKLRAYAQEHPRTLGVNFTLGSLLLDAARSEEAVQSFRSELALKPNHVASWAQLGSAYERLGNFDEVVACFRKQAELSPDDWKPNYRAGLVLRKYLARLEEAEAELAEARRRHPKGAEARLELARVWMDLGRDTDAERLLREILSDHPDHPEAHLHLGQTLVRRGETKEGDGLLARFKVLAEERDRIGQLEVAGTAKTQCMAGEEFLKQRKWRKAQGAFRKAIDLDANNPCGYVGVARTQISQEKFREALARLAQAGKIAPDRFDVHFYSACALAGVKREPEALGALRKAREMRKWNDVEREQVQDLFKAAGFENPFDASGELAR